MKINYQGPLEWADVIRKVVPIFTEREAKRGEPILKSNPFFAEASLNDQDAVILVWRNKNSLTARVYPKEGSDQ